MFLKNISFYEVDKSKLKTVNTPQLTMITGIKTSVTIIGTLLILLAFAGCATEEQPGERTQNEAIFPKGELGSEEFFTGNVWVTDLVENDSVFTTLAGSVEFEAGARSHWHTHPAGQILLVTSGTGYHQIEGETKEIIRKGDVVKCPPGVSHWHGASAENSMTHIYIIPNTEQGIVEWGEAVTDEVYRSAR